jgi:hypothetical protein
MSTAALIVACLAGSVGFGCLLAGILLLREFPKCDPDDKHQRRRLAAEFFDATFLFGVVTTAHDIAKNWNCRRDARRFIYAGLGSLFLMIAALYFR